TRLLRAGIFANRRVAFSAGSPSAAPYGRLGGVCSASTPLAQGAPAGGLFERGTGETAVVPARLTRPSVFICRQYQTNYRAIQVSARAISGARPSPPKWLKVLGGHAGPPLLCPSVCSIKFSGQPRCLPIRS